MKEWTKSTTQETKGQRGWKASILCQCKTILSVGKRSRIRNTPNWDQFCKIIFEIKEGPFVTMFSWRWKEVMVSGQKQRQPFLSLSLITLSRFLPEKRALRWARGPGKELGHVGWFLPSPSQAGFPLPPPGWLWFGVSTDVSSGLSTAHLSYNEFIFILRLYLLT